VTVASAAAHGALHGPSRSRAVMPPKARFVDLGLSSVRLKGMPSAFEFVHGGRRFAAEIFNGVLVSRPVGALGRVIYIVQRPVIFAHVASDAGEPPCAATV